MMNTVSFEEPGFSFKVAQDDLLKKVHAMQTRAYNLPELHGLCYSITVP